MDKTEAKRMSTKKKLALAIIAIPTALILYLLTMTYIVSPIQDSYDKLRFDQLNTEMNKVYNQVLATAGDKEEWKYNTECEYDSENVVSAGAGYRCTMEMFTIVLRTDIADTGDLHEKYYPIINSTTFLAPREPILIDTYSDLAARNAIRDAYIRYSSDIDESVECSYFIHATTLSQINVFHYSLSSFRDFAGETDIIEIEIECQIHSNQDWYG